MSKISELSDGGSLQSTDYLIAVRSGGNVKVRPNGAVSGTTGQFSTSLNVDGTVTADGLTVDGASNLTNTSAGAPAFALVLQNQSSDTSTAVELGFDNTATANKTSSLTKIGAERVNSPYAGDTDLYFKTQTNGGSVQRLKIATTGDISFYEDTGTTPKFFWDASAESLGVGTASPQNRITISGATPYLSVLNGTAGSSASPSFGGIRFYGFQETTNGLIASVDGGNAQATNLGGILRFSTQPNAGGGLAERMRIDSSGVVQISNATPTLQFTDTDNNYDATIQGLSGSLVLTADSGAEFGTESIQFKTGATERARLDASGNLLVGTTDTNPTTGTSEGIVLGAGGIILASNTSDAAIALNRTTTDGKIAIFKKNGNEVGSISTEGGNLYIEGSAATGKTGIEFSGAEWLPRDAGANSNGVVSLGDGSNRFKDLYLSGVANVGSVVATGSVEGNGVTIGASDVRSSSGTLTLGGTSEAMRIDSNGNLLVGGTDTNPAGNNVNGIALGFTGRISAQVSGDHHRLGRAQDGTIVAFHSAGGAEGSISISGSITLYNTSSDYRLKDVDGPITNSGAYIDALRPVQGSWKADGSRFIGLIAHEVQEVSETQIATGEKDGEEMQGMDYSAPELIANLIAEIQSLRARVAQLEGA